MCVLCLGGDLTSPRDYMFTVKANYWKMSLKTKTRTSTPMDFRYVEGYSRTSELMIEIVV